MDEQQLRALIDDEIRNYNSRDNRDPLSKEFAPNSPGFVLLSSSSVGSLPEGKNYWSGSPDVAPHSHNGNDGLGIDENNIVLGLRLSSVLAEDATESFTLRNISNVSRIVFNGFAANNADGSAATKRAIINGEVLFGTCHYFTGKSGGAGNTISISTANADGSPATKAGVPFIQYSNSMYIDSSDLTNTRVSANDQAIALAQDNTGATIVEMALTSYTNNSLTFAVILASNWKIQGAITIT